MIEAENPRIIKAGNDPNCVHYEKILGWVGTCQRCGQVKSYNSTPNGIWRHRRVVKNIAISTDQP
jgi:hypothetical protein